VDSARLRQMRRTSLDGEPAIAVYRSARGARRGFGVKLA
jgi:hypothetical protein